MNGGLQVYLVGGRQRRQRWRRLTPANVFECAIILHLDTAKGTATRCVEHVSAPNVIPDKKPTILFKAASLVGDRMYACTETEVVIFEVPSFRPVGYVSLPCFNDLHHVRPAENGSLLVVNTGLDMLLNVTEHGETLQEWSVNSDPLWGRFSKQVDYRKVASTKPHRSHPNFVFELRGELWVTRAIQHDAISMNSRQRFPVMADVAIHDGLRFDGSIYFTAVNGHVIEVDKDTMQIRRDVNLNEIVGRDTALGWCRGLEMLDHDHALVGFSRLRPTRHLENVHWVKQQFGGSNVGEMPTRVTLFDLRNGTVCWERNVEDFGLNTMFSIHRTPKR